MGKILILCDGDKQNTKQILNKNGVSVENISEVPANTNYGRITGCHCGK